MDNYGTLKIVLESINEIKYFISNIQTHLNSKDNFHHRYLL